MTKNNELFTTMPVTKAVGKLVVPTVVSQIIVIIYSLADTFFIGQIGDPNQLAALSITFPIYTVLTAIANLFGIGANSVISRSLGQNDEIRTKKTSAFSFWMSLAVTLLLSVLLALFMEPILLFFGANTYTLLYTKDYLFWVFVIGGVPTVAGLILGHLVRAVGKTKEAGIGLTIGGIMNILLDPIFIFTFKMDVAGASLATMISNTVSMLYFFVILFYNRKTTVIKLNPKYFTFKKNVAWSTVSVGFPAAISVLLVSFSISLLNGLLLHHEGGTVLSAAYGVTSKCGTIALHISIGIAQGVMPLIGYNYGAKNHKRVHQVCRLSFVILWIFSIFFLVVVQIIPQTIVAIFTPDRNTIEVGSIFMRCWSWCVIGMSLFNMYNSIFQAVGKWKTSLILAILRLGIIFPVFSITMNIFWGVTGLMWVQTITDSLSCLLAVILYSHFKKKLEKQFSQQQPENSTPHFCHNIITISREFGSGGRTIGKEVASKLGIPCYDSDLIEKIAQESGFAREYVERYGEYAQADTLFENALAGREQDGQSTADKLWFAQEKVIKDLAQKSSCVIVGRCADYILQNVTNCLTVFIHASDEKRTERIVTVYGQREESPVQRLHEKDKKRKAFYELYTGTQWGVAENYEVCLDSGKIGINGCIAIISAMYKHKFAVETKNNAVTK